LGSVVLFPATSAANLSIQTITYTGQPIPDVPGSFWTDAPLPVLNRDGLIAYASDIPGAASTANSAIWYGPAGDPRLIFREGDPAPGLPSGTTFAQIGDSWNLGSSGRLLTTNYLLSNGNPIGAGVWSVSSVEPTYRVVLGGDPAPLLPGYTLSFSFIGLRSDEIGGSYFFSTYSGPGVTQNTQYAIWGGPRNNLRPIMLGGAPAPGALEHTWEGVGSNPSVAASGLVAFITGLSAPAVPYNDTGIWAGTFGGVNLVIREGVQAPGALPGQLIRRFDTVAVNSSGQVIFRSNIGGTGDNELIGTGLWAGTPGALQVLALGTGTGVPRPDNIPYTSSSNPAINDLGQVAFGSAAITPTGSRPVCVAGFADDLRVLAMSGEQAPDVPPGVLFSFTSLEPRPLINDLGDVVLMLGLSGTGVSSANDRAIWHGTVGGDLHLLVREGDQLFVNGVDRTIASFQLFSPPSHLQQVLFLARFTDGTSASVIVSVPEPACGMLGLAMVVTICRRRSDRTSRARTLAG
jgi:hypothetical protein